MQKSVTNLPFLWGSATSSHQIEGNNQHNDWWAWEAEGNIEGGVRSGLATDHWNRWKEDLKMAADLGMNSYRFSVEWSRLEPTEGHFDQAAFDWYLQLILECERLGMAPMLTLHHFTSPKWFADQGGFTWTLAADKFALFVKEVAVRLGAHVPLWCTINEPMVLVSGGYLGKFMPPAHSSPELAAKASHYLLKSHALAYKILHETIRDRKGPYKDSPLQVGIAHNMLDFLPARRWHPLENALAMMINRAYNQAWLDAITGGKQKFGIPGIVPRSPLVWEAFGKKTVDFIGVNYYTKAYVQWRPKTVTPERPANLPIGIEFAQGKEKVSDVGWAIHPKGFEKMIRFVARYKLPIYITENGIADRDDLNRPHYLATHLKVIAEAIQEGIDIRGYYYWSLLDNFEWIKGFGPRFGLFKVDYETMARTPTASAELYKKVIQAHQKYDQLKPNAAEFKSV